jgi:NADH-quinone oxidoreductase subunit L
VIVGPVKALGGFFHHVMETRVIDGLVNGVGKAVQYSSRQLRLLQSGLVGSYVLLMVLGMLLLFILQLFFAK